MADDTRLISLGRVLQILREEENIEVLIQTTIDYLGEEFDYQLVWISFYDRLEHRLLGKGGIIANGDVNLLKQHFILNAGDILEQVVIQQRSLNISDLRTEPRAGEWRRIAEKSSIQSTLLFPLCCKDRCFGIALLGSQSWGVAPTQATKSKLSMVLGTLASTLHHMETEWQHSNIKRAEQPLFQTLEHLSQQKSLVARLEPIINLTQEFICPSRTNLYWYDQKKRYFWHRLGNRQATRGLRRLRDTAPGVKVSEAYDFYETMVAGKLVAIGSARSPLKYSSTKALLSRLKVRSLLAAPISVQDRLVGFVAVEEQAARIWDQVEQNYIVAAAQLIALVVAGEERQVTLEQTQADINLAAQIAHHLNLAEELPVTLKNCAQLLLRTFQVEGFFLLHSAPAPHSARLVYNLVHQECSAPLLLLTEEIAILDYQEQLLEQDLLPDEIEQMPSEVIAIEDWESEPRLNGWRQPLEEIGVRSLLVCWINNPIVSGVMILAQSSPRTWNQSQSQMVRFLAQQLGWLLAVSKFKGEIQNLNEQKNLTQTGLSQIQKHSQLSSSVISQWLEQVASILSASCAMLLTWNSHSQNQQIAQVIALVGANLNVESGSKLHLDIASEPLIKKVISQDNYISCSTGALSPKLRSWLPSNNPRQSLILSLPTPMPLLSKNKGVVLFFFDEEQSLPNHLIENLQTLLGQFGWCYHQHTFVSRLLKQRREQQILNWYKHCALEMLYHGMVAINSATTMEAEDTLATTTSANAITSIQRMRSQQLQRQLENTLKLIAPAITEEKWHLSKHWSSVYLANILKRVLLLLEPLYQEYQVQTRVYEQESLPIECDRFKLECILYQLLTVCYQRNDSCGEINFYVQPWLDGDQELGVELFILQKQRQTTAESSSPQLALPENLPSLSIPISKFGSNLKVCSRMLSLLHGQLKLYHLEDGSYLTQLRIPQQNRK